MILPHTLVLKFLSPRARLFKFILFGSNKLLTINFDRLFLKILRIKAFCLHLSTIGNLPNYSMSFIDIFWCILDCLWSSTWVFKWKPSLHIFLNQLKKVNSLTTKEFCWQSDGIWIFFESFELIKCIRNRIE